MLLSHALRAASPSKGLRLIDSVSGEGGGQSVVLTVPAGALSGDFLLAFGYAGTAGTLWTVTGGGWTITNASNSTAPRLTAFYRTYDGVASTYTFNQNSGTSDTGVTLLVFRGGAFDVASAISSSGDPISIASVTASVANTLQVITAGGNTNYPSATPSGFTEIHLNTSIQPNWGVYYRQRAASGATGTVSVDMTGSSNTAAMQVIVKPS